MAKEDWKLLQSEIDYRNKPASSRKPSNLLIKGKQALYKWHVEG